MKKLILTITIVFSGMLVQAQKGYVLLKTGDTIRYHKIEEKGLNYKVYVENSLKPIKGKSSEISCRTHDPMIVLSKNEMNEFTGNLKKYTEGNTFGYTKKDYKGYSVGLYTWMGKIVSDNKIYHFIRLRTPDDIGCSGSNKNYLIFKFDDGSTIKLDDDKSDIDCNSNAVSTYWLDQHTIDKLKTNNVESIRFSQSERYNDYYGLYPNLFINYIEILNN